jgi:hypothetical protein
MSKWWGLVFVFGLVGGLAMAVGFSWKQAILFAVFAAYVERGLDMAATKPRSTFEPFYVSIIPNWEQILADYSIVRQTDEDWKKFRSWSEGKALPLVWYSVLRNDKDGLLIYRGAEGGFSTAFAWQYEVTKRRASPYSPNAISPEGFPFGVDLFVKQDSDVIQLGLEVDGDWWQGVSRDSSKPLEAREFLYGTERILLANLPLREFDLYWNEIDYDSKTWTRLGNW